MFLYYPTWPFIHPQSSPPPLIHSSLPPIYPPKLSPPKSYFENRLSNLTIPVWHVWSSSSSIYCFNAFITASANQEKKTPWISIDTGVKINKKVDVLIFFLIGGCFGSSGGSVIQVIKKESPNAEIIHPLCNLIITLLQIVSNVICCISLIFNLFVL